MDQAGGHTFVKRKQTGAAIATIFECIALRIQNPSTWKMLGSPETARRYRESLIRQREHDERLFADGVYSHLILPRHFMMFVVLWLALVIKYPNQRASKIGRCLAYAVICYLSFDAFMNVRLTNGGHGYLLGLSTLWAVLWGSVLLIFNDPARDFKRIEVKRVLTVDEKIYSPKLMADGKKSPVAPVEIVKGMKKTYHWQPIPDAWNHRAWWVADLLLSLRGINWNWRPAAIQGPPSYVLAELDPKKSDEVKPDGRRPRDEKNGVNLLKSAFYDVVWCYFASDAVKTLSMQDEYFTGRLDAPYPWLFSTMGTLGGILGKSYRLLLSAGGVYYALQSGFALTKLFPASVAVLFPGWPVTPIDEGWLYPPLNGPLLQSVADHGLAGLWGKWWHQLFRMAFTCPTRWALQKLDRSPLKASLMTIMVFCLSGLLHSGGNLSLLGPSQRCLGTFCFFLAQAPVMILETLWSQKVVPKLPFKIPERVLKMCRVVFVACWIYHISPLFADDIASGGLWFTEPAAVSLFTALGLNLPGEPWWRWEGYEFFRISNATEWWNRGIIAL